MPKSAAVPRRLDGFEARGGMSICTLAVAAVGVAQMVVQPAPGTPRHQQKSKSQCSQTRRLFPPDLLGIGREFIVFFSMRGDRRGRSLSFCLPWSTRPQSRSLCFGQRYRFDGCVCSPGVRSLSPIFHHFRLSYKHGTIRRISASD